MKSWRQPPLQAPPRVRTASLYRQQQGSQGVARVGAGRVAAPSKRQHALFTLAAPPLLPSHLHFLKSGKHSAKVFLGCLLSECSLSLASCKVRHGTARWG